MKRIDVFMPPLSHYGVLHHFTRKLHEALQKQGVDCRLLEAKKDDPGSFLKKLFDNPPECTLSFNGLLPDDQGRFFADMIRIPHVACIVDSPNSFVPLTRSAYTIITCVDQGSVEFFHGLGFNKVFFLPHAVESTLAPDPDIKKEYEVVMLSSCIDHEKLHSQWKKKFPKALCDAMEETIDRAFTETNIPYYQVFVEALDRQVNKQTGLDPQKISFVEVLDEIEMYLRGKDRVELVRAIKDAKVHLFGSADDRTGWKKYLGNQKNVAIHDPVPFEQALEIMKRSKIILNSCPWIHSGSHERILAGLACGALVITNENPYLKSQFEDGKSIVFYQPDKWDKANHRVNEYLANNAKREKIAHKGREIVMKSHTWEHRAAQLLKQLPAFL